MDDQISQLEQLLEESRRFTASNFSIPRQRSRSGGVFGGADTPEWLAWKTRVVNLVTKCVSSDSAAAKLARAGVDTQTEGFYLDEFEKAKGHLVKSVEMTIEILKSDRFNEAIGGAAPTAKKKSRGAASRKVFVVHGHDEVLKLDVARFVEKLGLEAVILAEQPNGGRTIIEKLEKHADDAGFAIVLLTPDDVGSSAAASSAQRSRARQNVIMELGYFIGLLTRSRVCALHKGDIELPSDILGVVYTPVAGNWKLQLASEMKLVWPDLDLNKAH